MSEERGRENTTFVMVGASHRTAPLGLLERLSVSRLAVRTEWNMEDRSAS